MVRTFASESDDKTEIQIRIQAERSHKMIWNMHFQLERITLGTKKVYLLTRELKEKRAFCKEEYQEIKMSSRHNKS